MRPLIGMPPLIKTTAFGYSRGIQDAGGRTVMLLPDDPDEESLQEFVSMCDGFVFPGGHDINPALYGEERAPHCGEVIDGRDRVEMRLLAAVLASGKPVLGICRGFQLINVYFGGTLYQDVGIDMPTPVRHRMDEPFNRDCHRVTVLPDTPLAGLIGAGDHRINSVHHQGVKRLAETLRVMAVSEDGLIEGYWLPGHRFLWGTQWHPDFGYMNDARHLAVFEALVRACRGEPAVPA